jgi:hypothetical protein
VRLEGLGQLKNPVTSGIEPATFRLQHSASNNSAGARFKSPAILTDFSLFF